jgi:hypothetical protein
MNGKPPADVCLILEGTYPYISGGVANWANDLLHAQRDLSFHLVCLMPRNADLTQRYTVPDNVTGVTRAASRGFEVPGNYWQTSKLLFALCSSKAG